MGGWQRLGVKGQDWKDGGFRGSEVCDKERGEKLRMSVCSRQGERLGRQAIVRMR